MKHALTAIVLTQNEEANLPACLDSLAGLDCEIFVVDSGSADRTREIAIACGATVVEHPFSNYAAQRNWAQNNLPISGDWLLHLDADERLTPELVAEICEVLGINSDEPVPTNPGLPKYSAFKPNSAVNGFLLQKRTIFMGRWIKHGAHYPSYHLRLFRRGQGACEERLYDQHFIVDGNIATLKHDYVDVITPDINRWIQRHTRWAELEAEQLLLTSNGHSQVTPAFFGNPIQRRRWLRNGPYGRAPLYFRAMFYWIYRYFLRLGFLDGKEGFIFHFLQGFWFRLLVDIKLEELAKSNEKKRLTGTDHEAG